MSTPQERVQRYTRLRDRKPRLVSEGDSWFDYPLFPNLIDRIDELERFAILRLEHSGDRLAEMIKPPAFDQFANDVERERPQAVLLSAGGNDMALEANGMFHPFNPGIPILDHLDQAVWLLVENRLRASLLTLVQRVSHVAPVVVHGYDHMIPAAKPVHIVGIAATGPWLLPALEANGIDDPGDQAALGAEIVDRFNGMLKDVAGNHPLDVVYVDLRGTLSRRDWENEIHPTRDGFKAVAKEFLKQLDRKLPPVLDARRVRDGGGQ
jgi:hypothetical protein